MSHWPEHAIITERNSVLEIGVLSTPTNSVPSLQKLFCCLKTYALPGKGETFQRVISFTS